MREKENYSTEKNVDQLYEEGRGGRYSWLTLNKTEVIAHFSSISIRDHVTLVHFISNHIYPQNKT